MISRKKTTCEPPRILYALVPSKKVEGVVNYHGLVSRSRNDTIVLFDDFDEVLSKKAFHQSVIKVKSGDMSDEGIIFTKSRNGIYRTEYVPCRFLEEKEV